MIKKSVATRSAKVPKEIAIIKLPTWPKYPRIRLDKKKPINPPLSTINTGSSTTVKLKNVAPEQNNNTMPSNLNIGFCLAFSAKTPTPCTRHKNGIKNPAYPTSLNTSHAICAPTIPI